MSQGGEEGLVGPDGQQVDTPNGEIGGEAFRLGRCGRPVAGPQPGVARIDQQLPSGLRIFERDQPDVGQVAFARVGHL